MKNEVNNISPSIHIQNKIYGSYSIKIATYLIALLLANQDCIQQDNMVVSSEKKEQHSNIYAENIASIESSVSYKQIFKEGIKRSLVWLNTIDQIPIGGKKIVYTWISGEMKGKILAPEMIKKIWLPEKFDISPRKITGKPISSMYFILGNRKFAISPDIGQIKKISLNTQALVIEVSVLFGMVDGNILFDKQEKLPDLMYRLWVTPKGKGEKIWFKAATIIEI